ncbi:MAG: bifunctional phosphopantothenoylcysteine decarboxylase/phosphopantothenate--cysteine ligase CoaBC [Bacteroidia bacterium]
MLKGRNILLGVTGSIAAYKAATLVRLLVKLGANVKVIMTRDAAEFVTANTLSVLSKNPVETDFFDLSGNWNNHVKLGLWADAFVIAPATANTLAKMAGGICDNLLLACYLSARCKTYIAPAMDLDMYRHSSTLKNIKTLTSFGNVIIPAESGELASGLHGEGRMAEPENIVAFLGKELEVNGAFKGKKILVNAGPTYEAIDPVRFIGNRSSGKMGIAVAEAFAKEGADVTLVLGPTYLSPEHHGISCIRVESAEEMKKICLEFFPGSDVAILSAAVADYKPESAASEKIKKSGETMEIKLVKNADILFELGKLKKTQCLAGFALETENLIENSRKKLESKNLDFIIANTTKDSGAGFGGDTNKITIIDKHNKIHNFELKTKVEAAKDIVNFTKIYLGL